MYGISGRILAVAVCGLFAGICSSFASENFLFHDAGQARVFELALDEIAVSKGQRIREVTVIPAKAGLSDLKSEISRRSRDLGEDAELVLYQIEDGQRVGVPRIVTREILIQVAPGRDAVKLAVAAGAVLARPSDFGNDQWIVTAPDSAATLELVAALKLTKGVVYAEPLLARQQSKKFVPNDTFFTNQWHLRNTGQFNGVAGNDVRITNVWASGYRGTNIYIAIVDDGLQTAHPDLAANVDTAIDWDFNGNDADPNPGTGDDHGTACAGVAASVGNNNLGVSGAAPQARLVGLRLISAAASDAQEAQAMNWSNSIIHIKSNSWGPTDSGSIIEGPGALTKAALSNTCAVGRNGLGSLIFWAGGNGLLNSDDSNLDGYANSIYTISVAANDIRGKQSWYSEPGANHVICAPSSGDNNSGADIGIWTTDRTGTAGYNTGASPGGDYATDFGGTSSSCPLAAGIGALMIDANPLLGWRDVQEILIRTATRNDPSDNDWRQNGAGFWFNHKFGGGMINASGAVARALTWTNLGPQVISVTNQTGLSVSIPDNNAAGITRTFNVSAGMRLEHVVVTVNINHGRRRDMQIDLISPAGTTSVLAYAAAKTGSNFPNWSFMTVRNWGEAVAGTWTLRVADRRAGTTGTLTSAGLTFYGTATDVPSNQPPAIFGPANQTAIIGSNVSFAVTAIDAIDNDPVTLVASNLPPGATFGVTNGNGFFTWNTVGPTGVYNIIFHAFDKDGFNIAPVTITVEPVPVFISGLNSAAITINDNAAASPYPSTITLNGVGGVIDRVIVSLNGFSHTYPSDVDVILVGPGGQKSVVMGRVGGAAGVSNLALTFDDAAESAVGASLDSGIYKPSGTITTAMPAPAPGLPYVAAFTNFVGLSPYGTWSLYVADRAAQDVGSISGGWSLQVKMAGLAALSNQPPILSAIGSKTVVVSNNVIFAVSASDPYDGDPVTLVVSNLPAGATFGVTNGNGTFSWSSVSPTGIYQVVFHAYDMDGFASETVSITVTEEPDYLTYVEDFDTTANWGGGTAGSYNTKFYTNNAALPAGDYFESNSAIRDTTDSITGNAWRLGSESTTNIYFRYVLTNAVRRFALRAARWDNSPNPNFQIRYSLNSGSSYTTLFSTNGNWFTADKVYRTYDSGPLNLIPEAGQKIYIELFRSTGERMFVDNFEVDVVATAGGGDDGGTFTNILFQGFEPGDGWSIVSGHANISTNRGQGDTPSNQRIRTGDYSWQVNNAGRTVELAQVAIQGYTGRYVSVRVSSTSTNATNGADVGDTFRLYTALDGAAFSSTADISITGSNNVRWGFWATNEIRTTAGSPVSFAAPQGNATTTNAYANLYVLIPDAATSVALRIVVTNNASQEYWNVDDIALGGYDMPVEPELDSDNDGIPDQWEMDNFGGLTNVNEFSDWDGDGFSDVHEFLAGTQPTNNASFLRVDDGMLGPGGGIVIQWPGVTGKFYSLSRTTNLIEAVYQFIATNIPGVEPLNIHTDAAPVEAGAIYRIALE